MSVNTIHKLMGYFTGDKRLMNRLFTALPLSLSNRTADRDNYRF